MTRLIRLLPLAALVLNACSVTQPKGPGKSPDSPQWRQQQQAVVILPRLLPEEAGINLLFVREISKRAAGLVLT